MSRCEREAENVQFKSGLNFYQIWSFRRLIYEMWKKYMRCKYTEQIYEKWSPKHQTSIG